MSFVLQDSAKGAFYAIAATLFWAGNLVLARAYITEIPPVALAVFRWLVALLILTPVHFPAFWRQRRLLWRCRVYLTACAFLAVTLFNTLLYVASETVPAFGLALISTSLPVFILMISLFWLRDALRVNEVLGVFISLSGIVTLITDGDWQALSRLQADPGYAWMIVATLSFALYSIMLRNKPAELGGWLFLYSTFFIGFIMLLPFYLWEREFAPPVAITADFIVVVLYLGLFASIGSFYAWNQAVLLMGPKRTAPFYYLIAVFAGIGGWIFLDEAIGWLHLLCMGLIVSGIFIANLDRRST